MRDATVNSSRYMSKNDPAQPCVDHILSQESEEASAVPENLQMKLARSTRPQSHPDFCEAISVAIFVETLLPYFE
jgi:hypothetical protein